MNLLGLINYIVNNIAITQEDYEENIKMFLFEEDMINGRIPENQDFHEVFLEQCAERFFE